MNVTYRRTLAVGGTAAVILGLGGTALAASGSDTTSGTPSSTSAKPNDAKHKGDHKGKHKLLKRLEHGQFVTKSKDGAVTHTLYRGAVTAVSPTSVTVKAADGKSQSFVVTKDTKIVERAKGKKPVASSIAKIAKGDQVVAAGTGTTKVTAKHLVEVAK